MLTFEFLSLEKLVNVIIMISFIEIIVLCFFLKNIDKILKQQFFF